MPLACGIRPSNKGQEEMHGNKVNETEQWAMPWRHAESREIKSISSRLLRAPSHLRTVIVVCGASEKKERRYIRVNFEARGVEEKIKWAKRQSQERTQNDREFVHDAHSSVCCESVEGADGRTPGQGHSQRDRKHEQPVFARREIWLTKGLFASEKFHFEKISGQ
jgi:hypothetical protein